MTTDSDEYERLIKALVENLQKSEESGRKIDCLGYGRTNTIEGEKGQHQIDVSFIDKSCDPPRLVLIECKRWTSKIKPSVPKILKYNMDDIGAKRSFSHKNVMGIIVSTMELQPGAQQIVDQEKQIIFRKVNDSPPIGFDYENIIQTILRDDLTVGESVKVEIDDQS